MMMGMVVMKLITTMIIICDIVALTTWRDGDDHLWRVEGRSQWSPWSWWVLHGVVVT